MKHNINVVKNQKRKCFPYYLIKMLFFRRYILVTQAKESRDKMLANPIEAQLILERFPQLSAGWLAENPNIIQRQLQDKEALV